MKKAILKLEVRDDEQKKEVLDTVSGFSGVDSFSMDMKEKELTVIGDFDPVNIVSKLKKLCHTEIVSVVVPVNEDKPCAFKLDTSYKPIYNPPLKVAMYTYSSPPKTADNDTSSARACVIL